MILLDTHIWTWRVLDFVRLTPAHRRVIEAHQSDVLGVSVFFRWEVAKLVQTGRFVLPLPVGEWIAAALAYPGIRLIELTPTIAVAATRLPGEFHRDPADQIIVATAREYDRELITIDERILNYPHVRTVPP